MALSNSLDAKVLSLESNRANVRLGESAGNPLAAAASSLATAPAGEMKGVPPSTAKIGQGGDQGLMSNSLAAASNDFSAGMTSALRDAAPPADGSSLTSTLVLGSSMPDLSNVLGDQIRNNQKIGR